MPHQVIARKGAFCPDAAISETKKRNCFGGTTPSRNDNTWGPQIARGHYVILAMIGSGRRPLSARIKKGLTITK